LHYLLVGPSLGAKARIDFRFRADNPCIPGNERRRYPPLLMLSSREHVDISFYLGGADSIFDILQESLVLHCLCWCVLGHTIVRLSSYHFYAANPASGLFSILYAQDAKAGRVLAGVLTSGGISGPSVSKGQIYVGTGTKFASSVPTSTGIVAIGLPSESRPRPF
jgi:hypothetical protein